MRERAREKWRCDALIHHISETEINPEKLLGSHNQPIFLTATVAKVLLSQWPRESRLGPLLRFVFILT